MGIPWQTPNKLPADGERFTTVEGFDVGKSFRALTGESMILPADKLGTILTNSDVTYGLGLRVTDLTNAALGSIVKLRVHSTNNDLPPETFEFKGEPFVGVLSTSWPIAMVVLTTTVHAKVSGIVAQQTETPLLVATLKTTSKTM
jgi:hypothetical protein